MPLENLNPVKIFSEGGLDDLLINIDKEARSHVSDLKTDKGRKAIASMAAKVAKSKTYLDGLGKDLVSDWKNKSKVVDGERKKMRDTLDNLKADVRKPLTDWEDAETARVEAIHREIEEMILAGNLTIEQYLILPLQSMKDRLSEIENEIELENLNEFKDRYDEVKLVTLTKIKESIERREKHDADQKELEELRIEKEKRDEKDRIDLEAKERTEREERIAKEVKEKVEKEAEENIKRIEVEKQQAIEKKKEAEQRADNAAKAEREKIETEKLEEQKAAEKREANTKHKKKINNESVIALVAIGLTDDLAKKVVTAIAKKEVPNVSIFY